MLSDIVIGAVEGGTGYWAVAANYRWSGKNEYPASATLVEGFDGRVRTVPLHLDIVAVENAMFRIAHDHKLSVSGVIREHVIRALATNDAGDCDSDVADIVAQVAAFGEIVYG